MTETRWDVNAIQVDAKRRIKPPLSRGDVVVWTLNFHKATSGISPAHRYHELGKTYCWQQLPKDPNRLVELSLVIGAQSCPDCERLHEAGATVAEAEQDNVNRSKSLVGAA